MSAILSISSRQLVLIVHFSITQSLHSSEKHASMRGIATSSAGGSPSGSFHTKSSLFCSLVGHAFTRALGGIRLLYGILLHLPSAPQLHAWNGHATELPRTWPRLRSAPMCG